MGMFAVLGLYVVGGLTFFPLCLVVTYVVVIYTAKPVPNYTLCPDESVVGTSDTSHETKAGDRKARSSYRSGSLVVTRHWPHDGTIIEAPPGPPPLPKEGILTRSGGYVSAMYRGLVRSDKGRSKTRSKGVHPTADHEDTKDKYKVTNGSDISPPAPASKPSQAKKVRPGDASFHAILKESILYLYRPRHGAPAPGEVYAAIDLRGTRVSIYGPWIGDALGPLGPSPGSNEALESGVAPDPIPQPPGPILDADLFLRRNAVRIVAPTSQLSGEKASSDNPTATARNEWFVFAPSAPELEDWYFALFRASLEPPPGGVVAGAYARAGLDPADPVGAAFSRSDMADLMARLDEVPDPLPLRWFNALLGRYWVGICHTAWTERVLTAKLRRKLSRVKKPAFLGPVEVVQVNLGSAPPLFGRPMLKALTAEGEASMEASVHYKGRMRVVISTVLTLGLPGLKNPAYTYGVPLSLAVELRSLEGNAVFTIKPPPSNRMWWAFTRPPQMDFAIIPGVSARQVQWALITRTIEAKIKELVVESLVFPNMDDFVFFDSSEYAQRGGIWADAIHDPHEPPSASAELEAQEDEEQTALDTHEDATETATASPIPIPGAGMAPTSTSTPSSSGPTVAISGMGDQDGLTRAVDASNAAASVSSIGEVRQRRKGRTGSTPLSAAASLTDVLARNDAAQVVAAQKTRRSRQSRTDSLSTQSSLLDGTLGPHPDYARRRSWFQRAKTSESDSDIALLAPPTTSPLSSAPPSDEPVEGLLSGTLVVPSTVEGEDTGEQSSMPFSASEPSLSLPRASPLRPQVSFDHLSLESESMATPTPLRPPSVSIPLSHNEDEKRTPQDTSFASESELGNSSDSGVLDVPSSVASCTISGTGTAMQNEGSAPGPVKSETLGTPLTDAADRPLLPRADPSGALHSHSDMLGHDSSTSQALLNTWRRAAGGIAAWTNRRSVLLDSSSIMGLSDQAKGQRTPGSVGSPSVDSAPSPGIVWPRSSEGLLPSPMGRVHGRSLNARSSSINIRRAATSASSVAGQSEAGSPSTTASSSSHPSLEFLPARPRATIGLSLPSTASMQPDLTHLSANTAVPDDSSNTNNSTPEPSKMPQSSKNQTASTYAPSEEAEAGKNKVYVQPLGAPAMVVPGLRGKANPTLQFSSRSEEQGTLDPVPTATKTTDPASPPTPTPGPLQDPTALSPSRSPEAPLTPLRPPAPTLPPPPPRAALVRSPERSERRSTQAGITKAHPPVHETIRPVSTDPRGSFASLSNTSTGSTSFLPHISEPDDKFHSQPNASPSLSIRPAASASNPWTEDEMPPPVLAAPWGAL